MDLEKMKQAAEGRMVAAALSGDEETRQEQEEIFDALEELAQVKRYGVFRLWSESEAALIAMAGAFIALVFVGLGGAILFSILEIIGGLTK